MPVSWVSPRHPARGRLFVMLRSSPPPRAGILCEFFAFTHGCRMSQDSPRELLDQLIEQAPDDDERPSKSQLKREMHALQALGEAIIAMTPAERADRKSTRLNSSHVRISYAV